MVERFVRSVRCGGSRREGTEYGTIPALQLMVDVVTLFDETML